MSCLTTLFCEVANHQIRYQATRKVGCQPGDSVMAYIPASAAPLPISVVHKVSTPVIGLDNTHDNGDIINKQCK